MKRTKSYRFDPNYWTHVVCVDVILSIRRASMWIRFKLIIGLPQTYVIPTLIAIGVFTSLVPEGIRVIANAIIRLTVMFLPLGLLSDNWIELVTINRLCIKFVFSSKIFFATHFPCGIQCTNPVPPLRYSTFRKHTFKRQLGCQFSIVTIFMVFWGFFLHIYSHILIMYVDLWILFFLFD